MLDEKKEKLLLELLVSMGLISEKHYGYVGINLQAGNIIYYDKKETIKRKQSN